MNDAESVHVVLQQNADMAVPHRFADMDEQIDFVLPQRLIVAPLEQLGQPLFALHTENPMLLLQQL